MSKYIRIICLYVYIYDNVHALSFLNHAGETSEPLSPQPIEPVSSHAQLVKPQPVEPALVPPHAQLVEPVKPQPVGPVPPQLVELVKPQAVEPIHQPVEPVSPQPVSPKPIPLQSGTYVYCT